MTETDIKKGIDCCSRGDCGNCPYEGHAECIDEMLKATLDLINTLEAENERLRGKQ